ncbi:alpha-galactosidase [Arcanobacterium wilhelmae]|uniref:alpha-galactosidase n=1 Tax=Arcanobacterium wilhelmae TaxID=1803177 RepID=A0ABT9ND65_9ACTO|nr:alpha-galactosidase [Arcanobacterium wilhelmae]MDP9801669.1 alpha-galactosidase [Arcanobacterium wilhelmae]WFN90990.1 alpha-galactosidase [Arcanobacterium wilhelmae]
MATMHNDVIIRAPHSPHPVGVPSVRPAIVLSPTSALPVITYWGEDLPLEHPALLASQSPQLINAGIDRAEIPSILPHQAEGWSGAPFLMLRRDGIAVFPAFTVREAAATESRYELTADADGVELHYAIALEKGGLAWQEAKLTNTGAEPLEVVQLRLAFPVPSSASELLTFSGHHLRERAPIRSEFSQGLHSQQSWMGRPDFNSGFMTIAGTPGFGFTRGAVYASHVAWSGNVEHFALRTPYSAGLIGGSELLYPGEVVLEPGASYTSPRVYGGFGHGLNEVSHQFHTHIRALHAMTPGRELRRPVTLNTWEAVYFDQRPGTLLALAQTAAETGVERFVVDDGWFVGRSNDFQALGDWYVSTEKWPNGLEEIAGRVHSLGMEFGLWFEPEMISLDSGAARAHPEWVLRPSPDRLPLPGRHEYVIDLTNPRAFSYLFDRISTLIGELGIDYIKWDHNRFITEAISPATGRPAVHDQTLAYYRLVRELRTAHPQLVIENCASGGGRVDLAAMAIASSVWASDCTDPVERATIQRYTSLLVPPEMIGAHVAASPSHQTNRTTTLTTRAAVAFCYGFGFEMDISRMSDFERVLAREWVALHRELIEAPMNAVHGDSSDPSVTVDGVVSVDCQHAVYAVTQLATSANYPIAPIQLPGLRPELVYRVRPLGGAARYSDSDVGRPAPAWWNDEGIEVPGRVLTDWGLRSKHVFPGNAVLLEVDAVALVCDGRAGRQ